MYLNCQFPLREPPFQSFFVTLRYETSNNLPEHDQQDSFTRRPRKAGRIYENRWETQVPHPVVTIYISIHPLNRLYLKAIQEMLKIKNDWI